MSNILKKLKVNRQTLREILLSAPEDQVDEDYLTTIAIRYSTKLRLGKFINKNETFDQGISRILDWLEKNADRTF